MGSSQEGSKTVPNCSAAQLSNLTRVEKRRKQTEQEGEVQGEEITAAKKVVTNSIYYTHSKALPTLLNCVFYIQV